jgi:hypothetical protein
VQSRRSFLAKPFELRAMVKLLAGLSESGADVGEDLRSLTLSFASFILRVHEVLTRDTQGRAMLIRGRG